MVHVLVTNNIFLLHRNIEMLTDLPNSKVGKMKWLNNWKITLFKNTHWMQSLRIEYWVSSSRFITKKVFVIVQEEVKQKIYIDR